jgi:hypothetical protein
MLIIAKLTIFFVFQKYVAYALACGYQYFIKKTHAEAYDACNATKSSIYEITILFWYYSLLWRRMIELFHKKRFQF